MSDQPGRPPDEQWWVINGAELMSALMDAADGDDPEVVYLELVANSSTEPAE